MSESNNPSIFPRTLILTSSVFNQYSGGGVLLSNLFRGWPVEKLATAFSDLYEPDTSVCQRFFRLGPEELRPAFPLGWLPGVSGAPQPGAGSGAALPSSRWRSYLKPLANIAIGPEIPRRIHLSEKFARWIEEFKPDVLYTLVGGPHMRAAVQISERWKIPIVAHMMDDWPSEMESKFILFPFYRRRALKDLKSLFSKAAVRMSICDSMSEAYQKKYGVPFTAFQNVAELEKRLPHTRTNWDRNKPFRIIYIGSILPNAQLNSLADVARSVSELKDEGLDIEMRIHSPWAGHYKTQLKLSPAVQLYPGLNESDIFGELTSADALLIPVNFDSESLRYIRYSMPAKIPIYLVSGTPILVYGPPEAASVQYAAKDSWAVVVNRPDMAVLKNALRALFESTDLREKWGRAAVATAKKNHDGSRIRTAFRTELARAARFSNGNS